MNFEVTNCDLKLFSWKFDTISYGKKRRKRRDKKESPAANQCSGTSYN
jgi:hypothetical protein